MLLELFLEVFTLRVTENIDVSLARIFALGDKLSDKSSIKIKNNNERRKDTCGTPARALVQGKL